MEKIMAMELTNYTGFFHDGDLREIKHVKNNITLVMESSEILSEWTKGNITLSNRNTMSGKLHISGVKNIKETWLHDDDISQNLKEFRIKDGYENGNIYRFKLKENKIIFIIYWIQYLPDYQESGSYRYDIEADKIYWENIPDISNAYWELLREQLQKYLENTK